MGGMLLSAWLLLDRASSNSSLQAACVIVESMLREAVQNQVYDSGMNESAVARKGLWIRLSCRHSQIRPTQIRSHLTCPGRTGFPGSNCTISYCLLCSLRRLADS